MRLALGLIALLAGCTGTPSVGGLRARTDTPLERATPTSNQFGACDASAATQSITFVHVNDTHGHYVPARDGISPLARIRGYATREHERHPSTVFTSGGDDYEKGAVAELLSRGAATREVVFAMQYDVRVLGNHDFAWGPDEVTLQTHDPHARVLSSNVTPNRDDWRALDYTEMTVGCLRVGFFGLLPEPVDETDKPARTDYLPGFRTDLDWASRARQIIAAHRSQVHLMVLVSHLGHQPDEKLAHEVDGIDVILGAHTHEAFRIPREFDGRTVMVQAGTGAEHISRLSLRYRFDQRRVDDIKHELVAVDDKLPVDPTVQATVERVMARDAPDFGKTLVQVAGQVSKSDLARLAGRAAMKKLGADAALVRDDIAFASLDPGPLSQQTIANALPVQREPPGSPGFTSFYVATVTGATLASLREKAGDKLLFVGPEHVEPAGTYKLAVTKLVALHPDRAASLALTAPVPGCEAWEAVDAYARSRTAACLPLDRDTPIAGCTPTARP